MASTYSDLKIELIGTGEQVGTWGSTTNTNLGTALEEAIVGSADVAFSSADVTLTLTNTNGTQSARHLRLNLTGTSGGARNLILGSGCQIDKPYIIANGLADTVTVKNTTGTGIAVPAGKTMWIYNNGTNVVEAMNHSASLTLTTPLPVASGGTGSSTAAFNGANITDLNASNISSGTIANARTTATSSNTPSTIVSRDGSGDTTVGTLNATAVSATTVSDGIGNVRDIPINTQTTSYTLVASDAGKFISTDSDVTIPSSVFSTGDVISVYNSTGSTINILAGVGTTVRRGATALTGNRTLSQYGVCTILCTASNNFVVTGAGIE
jgi:hypothetical protein